MGITNLDEVEQTDLSVAGPKSETWEAPEAAMNSMAKRFGDSSIFLAGEMPRYKLTRTRLSIIFLVESERNMLCYIHVQVYLCIPSRMRIHSALPDGALRRDDGAAPGIRMRTHRLVEQPDIGGKKIEVFFFRGGMIQLA